MYRQPFRSTLVLTNNESYIPVLSQYPRFPSVCDHTVVLDVSTPAEVNSYKIRTDLRVVNFPDLSSDVLFDVHCTTTVNLRLGEYVRGV